VGNFVKPRKMVLVLAQCYSRHKAIIMNNVDDGTSHCRYSHALVSEHDSGGIDHYPHKVTAAKGKKKIAKQSKIKSFVKVYNYNHLMPIRYSVDSPLDKTVFNKHVFRDPDSALKRKALREAADMFEENYKMDKNKWFFQKLWF
uniref:60S ribosomal protein L27 n=1 Tax=Otolemur garnettii TaxID=30611 RepID=H0XU93_OTOGA